MTTSNLVDIVGTLPIGPANAILEDTILTTGTLQYRCVSKRWKFLIDNHVLQPLFNKLPSAFPETLGIRALVIEFLAQTHPDHAMDMQKFGKLTSAIRRAIGARAMADPALILPSPERIAAHLGARGTNLHCLFETWRQTQTSSFEDTPPSTYQEVSHWLTTHTSILNTQLNLDFTEKSILPGPLTALPAEIQFFSGLQHLDLAFCQLQTLPYAIQFLTELYYLDVRYNKLHSLPSEICYLTQLTYLNLSGNQIPTLPFEMRYLTALTILDLNRNRFKQFPPEIPYLTHLQTLCLNYNQLENLPPEIRNLTQLYEFSVCDNRLYSIPLELAFLTQLKPNPLTHPKFTCYRNPLLFVPKQVLDMFSCSTERGGPILIHGSGLEQFYDELHDSRTSSRYGALYSAMLKRPDACTVTEEIKQAFAHLHPSEKHLIFHHMFFLALSAKKSSHQWNEKNIFDDPTTLFKAIRESIFIKFQRFSPNGQYAVCQYIYKKNTPWICRASDTLLSLFVSNQISLLERLKQSEIDDIFLLCDAMQHVEDEWMAQQFLALKSV